MMDRIAALVCVLVAASSPLPATTTASWSADVADEFRAGTLDGTAIDRDGRVRLAPARQTWFGPDDGIVWQVRPSGEDAAFVALSGPGRLLRVGDGGEVETWFRAEGEGLVTALDVGADGRPVIGVSPDARVLRASGPDAYEELADLPAAFVWAIAAGGDDDVWVGTGVPGAVLRLRGGGLIETVFETGDDPVRALARHPGGGVVLGTGGRGRVIRIDEAGRPFVLFDADETEVVAVAVADDGTVWALAARGAKQVGSTGVSAAAAAAGATVRVTATPPPDPDDSGEAPQATAGPSGPARPKAPPSFRLPPGGALYRIAPAGDVRRVWTTGDELPFGLALGGPGRIIVTTGDEGSVHELDTAGVGTRLIRIASSQASAVAATPAGRLLVGGTTDARVEAIGAGPRRQGQFLTPAIDAGSSAEWGALHWDAELPRGGGVALHARAGNTDDPDETWTDWVRVEGGADTGRAVVTGVPVTRFLQVRATLTTRADGESPLVRRLEQFYRPRNRVPEVAEVGVEAPGIVFIPAPAQGGNALGPVVADDPVARQAAESLGRSRRMPMRRGWEAGARTFTWKADDPDGDRLRYRLDIRQEGGADWLPLAREIDANHLSWDGRGMPEGRYRVRVVASDALDNPDGAGLEDARVSETFLVDNGRPTVTGVTADRRDGGWRLAIAARDEGGVAAVEIAIDGGAWRPVEPADGVADGTEETFRVDVPAAAEGVRAVMIRVIDAAGNIGGTVWTP